MEAESSASVRTTTEPKPLAPSNLGRSVGKAHKSSKTALRRSYISPAIKTPFEKRKEKEQAREAVRQVEQEMKEESQAEQERWVPLTFRRVRRGERKLFPMTICFRPGPRWGKS